MHDAEHKTIRKTQSVMTTQRIAVIGSGIAGLATGWLLSQRNRVTLFEADTYLGGHTHTVEVTIDGITAPVDTGFLVYNDRTYPNLIALFAALGVQAAASDMSFSVRIDDEDLEWSGSSLATVFAQKRNLLRPEFWRMLKDIVRFNRTATELARTGAIPDVTLGTWLEAGAYSRAFRDWYLLPMSGAIWSCPPQQMLAYPAKTLIHFCLNHGLLQITDRPRWRTVVGGGRDYVWRLAQTIADVRLQTPVRTVRRLPQAVEITHGDGQIETFDSVVLACHSDQALALLSDADADEQAILGAVRYQPNHAVLHTDLNFLPRAREAWAAWNYHSTHAGDGTQPVGVSYLINQLQPLPFTKPVIVTLNPVQPPDSAQVIEHFDYAHPIFDRAAIAAQQALPGIQGRRRSWFCGAWTGYGFHEDGLKSALVVANGFGIQAPWQQTQAAA
jgi:predicted NAD/FAD-binding protein